MVLILAQNGGKVNFDVPNDLKAGSAKVKVVTTGGITHTSQADVKVVAKSVSIFIQTDKAMYKPSQTGGLWLMVNSHPYCTDV